MQRARCAHVQQYLMPPQRGELAHARVAHTETTCSKCGVWVTDAGAAWASTLRQDSNFCKSTSNPVAHYAKDLQRTHNTFNVPPDSHCDTSNMRNLTLNAATK